MAFENLRNFIDYLESKGELVRVATEVDPRYEIGAICRMALDRRAPALFFSKVKRSFIPIVTNLVASRKRYAMALESTPDTLHDDWLKRVERPLEPVLVDYAPCQENVLIGDEVDLGRLPVPTWNELDGGPYITYSCHISKDPDTGSRNAGMYRAQVHDRNHLGILAAPFKHIMFHRRKRPHEPLPVALALGLDPVIHIASCAPFPLGIDEIAMAGALRGKPVEMVRCKTIPIEVPACAEIVLEGEILPDVLREEGNFGEFTGYYGFVVKRPVIKIKAITFKNNPIYLGTYVGKPPHEDCQLKGIPVEFEIMRSVSIRGIKKVNVTEGGAGAFNCIVSIEKRFEGYGKMIAMAVLGTEGGRFIKNLIIVDDDINPYDLTEVEWAIATRVQPHRDVEIIKAVTGVILDPSLPDEERSTGTSRTSKLIIDATKYDAEKFEIPCLPDRETMQRVEKNWEKKDVTPSKAEFPPTALTNLMERRTDAIMASLGISTMIEADKKVGIKVLPFAESKVPFIRQNLPAFFGTKTPTGLPGVSPDVPVVATVQILVANQDMDDTTAYMVVKTLVENHKDLFPIHKDFYGWTPERAVRDLGIPYHPGAIKCYKEKGLWTSEMEERQRQMLATGK